MSLRAVVGGGLTAVLLSVLASPTNAADDPEPSESPSVARAGSLTVDAQPGSPTVGDKVSVTAKLTCEPAIRRSTSGRAGEEPAVSFVISGPHEAGPRNVDLDDGTASLSYTGVRPGLDVVTASIDPDLAGACLSNDEATVRVPWEAPPKPRLTVTATPDGTTGDVGTTFGVEVTVVVDGPLPTAPQVSLRAAMAGQPDIVRSQTSSSEGKAYFEYTRASPGRDRVLITAEVSGVVRSTGLTRTWVEPEIKTPTVTTDPPTVTTEPPTVTTEPPTVTTEPPTVTSNPPTTDAPTPTTLSVDLRPDGVTSVVGTDFTPVVRLTDEDGELVRDAPVTVQVVPVAGTSEEVELVTGPRGRARYTYSRDEPGTEQIIALAEAEDSDPVSATVSHTWALPPEQRLGCEGDLATSVTSGGTVSLACAGCFTDDHRATVDGSGTVLPTHVTGPVDSPRSVAVELAGVNPGTHELELQCGERTFTDSIDVVGNTVQSAAVGGSGSAATAVLLFFLLSGYVVVRRLRVGAPD